MKRNDAVESYVTAGSVSSVPALAGGIASPYDDQMVYGRMYERPRNGFGELAGAVATIAVMAVLCFGMIWLMFTFAGK